MDNRKVNETASLKEGYGRGKRNLDLVEAMGFAWPVKARKKMIIINFY